MQLLSLISQTNAYKVFKKDIENGTLSHAYLLVCEDGAMLEEYLKAFSKALFCESSEYCDNCRTCSLIDKKTLFDVKFYPTGDKIKVADIDDVVDKTYVKPIEFDKKAFILVNAQDMNAMAQNKLLKTLEEPPANTYIILGATTVYPLLSTVLSRVKRLDITPFSNESLKTFMLNYFGSDADVDKVDYAVTQSLGKLGEALKRYEEGGEQGIKDICYDILLNIKSSKDAYLFANKITKENYRQVLSNMLLVVRDTIAVKTGGNVNGSSKELEKIAVIGQNYTYGALIYMFDKFTELERKVNFNLNLNAVIDGILFGILEGKHKWQK